MSQLAICLPHIGGQLLKITRYVALALCLSFSFYEPALAQNSQAQTAQDSYLESVFKLAYPQVGTIYRPGQCGRNVKELLLELQAKDIDISGAKVLFLLGESRTISGVPHALATLLPSFNRSFEPSWDFHVILQLRDPDTSKHLILDLDGSLQPKQIKDYFSKMFPSKAGEDRLANITIRTIDSESYLKAFEIYHETRDPNVPPDENWVVGEFRELNLPEYPITTLGSYLGGGKSGSCLSILSN